jgi:phosphoribosylanthranilate isomerase
MLTGVKICGITTVDDGRATAAAGANAIGLNFYPKSPRFVSWERATAIAKVLPRPVIKVGLFVDCPVSEVLQACSVVSLDLVQLHGNEPPETLAQIKAAGGPAVMKAWRLGPQGLGPLEEYLERCRQLGSLPAMVLLDACQPGQFGGTGKTADWSVARGYPSQSWYPPLMLAGGLTAENVAEAIGQVRPAAVDTASGVESAPGCKDPVLVRQFVAAARRAFGALVGPGDRSVS